MPSPQTRLQACLIFYEQVSLCILWWTVQKSQGLIAVFLLFLLFIFDRMEKDTTCNMSIDDTEKFVYGQTETYMEISQPSGWCRTYKAKEQKARL